jgi:hypothetical protein
MGIMTSAIYDVKTSVTFEVQLQPLPHAGREGLRAVKDWHNDRDGVHKDLLQLLTRIVTVQFGL